MFSEIRKVAKILMTIPTATAEQSFQPYAVEKYNDTTKVKRHCHGALPQTSICSIYVWQNNLFL